MEIPPFRIQQMEVPKPSVGRFKWSLLADKDVVVATGTIFVFGQDVSKLKGWDAGQEYWYVSTLGVAALPVRFVVECLELVGEDQADVMLAGHAPTHGFRAAMVPTAQRLDANDAVLTRSSVHGVLRTSDLGVKLANDAAVCLELDGHTIKSLDWYWSGPAPLSLFPGGAKVGEQVELTLIRRGEAGFPQVGWLKCEQAA
jgi:hypothetical protein